MNYYERHIGDYLKDTAHLSLLEHGVYTRLMDVYYTREDGIPKAEAARLIGARTREEKQALDAILDEFFELDDEGKYRQERCEREIERFQSKSQKARDSVNKRWQAVQRSKNEGNTNVSEEGYERNAKAIHRAPVPRLQSPDTSSVTTDVVTGGSPPTAPPKATPKPVDPVKDEVWRTGRTLLEGQGMTRDAAGSFLGKLVKDHGQNRVLTAVREAARDPKADVRTWLVAACQQRETEGKQSALERRNATVAENWLPPEVRDAAV